MREYNIIILKPPDSRYSYTHLSTNLTIILITLTAL